MQFRKWISKDIAWGGLTFVLSLLSSSLAGRSLWCDEIIRIAAQKNYTVDQLLACKHLSDFDSQSPVGYILWRPMQSLLGIELGGFLLSAIAAALITYLSIAIVRRWKGSSPSLIASSLIALNPLLVYHGGELWFYAPWAAAFAFAFHFALNERPMGLIIAGLFFVSLHFAGIFVWFVFAAACCCVAWRCRGFVRAAKSAAVFAAPALLCLPLYLKAQFAAAHLDSQGVQLSRLASLPDFLWRYFVQIFPSLTGAWWLGVALMAVGFVFLFRSRRRAEAVVALAIAFGWILYSSYAYLRGYSFVVGRFWLFALAATLPLLAYGYDRIAEKTRAGFFIGVIVLVADCIGVVAVLQMDGRTAPYRGFANAINNMGEPKALICPNHYETRFFSMSEYLRPSGSYCMVPSYWEQGEAVQIQGLALIRQLSPLSPLYLSSPEQLKILRSAGYVATNGVIETRTPFFELASFLRVFPEMTTAKNPLSQILMPTESEVFAEAERKGEPVFLPGKGWRLASMPPQKADQPFTPVLVLAPDRRAELKVYVPVSFGGNKLTLTGYLGHGRLAAAPYAVQLDAAKKGCYVSATVEGGKDGAYFLYPRVK